MAGIDEGLSDAHFLSPNDQAYCDSCRTVNNSGGNEKVCRDANNILNAAPKLSNSYSGCSQCETPVKPTDTLENSMFSSHRESNEKIAVNLDTKISTKQENVSNRNSNSSVEDNSCHSEPNNPGVRPIANLPSPRNILAQNLNDGNSKPSSDTTRVKALDEQSDLLMNVIGDEDQPTDDNNLNTTTNHVTLPTVVHRPNINPNNSQEQDVKSLSIKSMEYLNQKLSTCYSKNWRNIADIHGWPADKINVFSQRCKDYREDPFEKMMYEEEFQNYNLKYLLEDLNNLPRKDMLTDKNRKKW